VGGIAVGNGVQAGEGLGVKAHVGVEVGIAVGVLVGVGVQVAVAVAVDVGVEIGVEVAVGVLVDGNSNTRHASTLSATVKAPQARLNKSRATRRPNHR